MNLKRPFSRGERLLHLWCCTYQQMRYKALEMPRGIRQQAIDLEASTQGCSDLGANGTFPQITYKEIDAEEEKSANRGMVGMTLPNLLRSGTKQTEFGDISSEQGQQD